MERKLKVLCPDMGGLGNLERDHIKAVGPYLLGDTAWGKVETR